MWEGQSYIRFPFYLVLFFVCFFIFRRMGKTKLDPFTAALYVKKIFNSYPE